MKNFKLYSKGGGTKQQTIWLGALLIIIAISVAVIGGINYSNLPQRTIEDADDSLEKLVLQQLYIAGGVGIIGIILLVGGSFASFEEKNVKKEICQNNNNSHDSK